MATTNPTLTDVQQEQYGELKKAQPTWSDQDYYDWGKRYYGWGADGTGSGTTGGSTAGGGGELPPSPPPPADGVAGTGLPPVTAPASGGANITVPPPPADTPALPGGIQSGAPTGTPPPAGVPGSDANVVTENAPKTVTIGGVTYTIPSAPGLNTNQTTGAAPSATANTLAYSPEDPLLGTVREQLLGLMTKANTAPTLDDPNLKGQADANYVAQERARRGLQEQAAAKFGAQGLGSSGALDQTMAQNYENMGQAVGEFNADLLGQESTARRGDLKDALGMANELGMFKEKSALEANLANLDVQTKTSLANLDAQLKNAGLTVQERLGIMDAELKKYGIELGGDMNLLQTVLGNEFNYAQLKVQGDIANLDAGVKMKLGQMDAEMRKAGYGTQERIAALDAEVRKYGIDTQGNLGNLELALKKELGIGELNLGLLNALLGNQNFNDQLGFNYTKLGIDANSNLMNYISGD